MNKKEVKIVGLIIGGNIFIAQKMSDGYHHPIKIENLPTPQGIASMLLPIGMSKIEFNDNIIECTPEVNLVKEYEKALAAKLGLDIPDTNNKTKLKLMKNN